VSFSTGVDARGAARQSAAGLAGIIGALVGLGLSAGALDAGSSTDRVLAVILPAMSLALAAAVLCLPLRWVAATALVGGVVAGPVRGLFYDPARDGGCTLCLPSAYAFLPDQGLAGQAAVAGGVLVMGALVVASFRQRSGWSAAGAAVAAASLMAFDSPTGVQRTAVWLVVLFAGLSSAVGFARRALARHAVAELADGLRSGESPDELLREHLRDSRVWVDFAAPPSAAPVHWLSATGVPVAEEVERDRSPARKPTPVLLRGVPVARIHGGGPVTMTAELALLLEQAGLEAGLSHQLSELDASRTRLVKRADAERRQLERDLHDGAQQYLLALAVDLALVEANDENGSARGRDALRASRIDAERALEELRDIAHGVYPVLLSSGGFRAALQALGRTVPATIALDGSDLPELHPVVMAGLYGLVEELARSTTARVEITVSESRGLTVEIAGGTLAPESLNIERVVASGARVEAMPGQTVARLP